MKKICDYPGMSKGGVGDKPTTPQPPPPPGQGIPFQPSQVIVESNRKKFLKSVVSSRLGDMKIAAQKEADRIIDGLAIDYLSKQFTDDELAKAIAYAMAKLSLDQIRPLRKDLRDFAEDLTVF